MNDEFDCVKMLLVTLRVKIGKLEKLRLFLQGLKCGRSCNIVDRGKVKPDHEPMFAMVIEVH